MKILAVPRVKDWPATHTRAPLLDTDRVVQFQRLGQIPYELSTGRITVWTGLAASWIEITWFGERSIARAAACLISTAPVLKRGLPVEEAQRVHTGSFDGADAATY
jgi:hypothetical protein